MLYFKWNLKRELLLFAGVFLHFSNIGFGQQIHWAKVYSLGKRDAIYCITKDENGYLYAGGSTERNIPGNPFTVYNTAFFMKLTQEGDSVFTRELGYGTIFSMAIDKEGIIRLNILSESVNPFVNRLLIMMKMTQDGFVFQRDTIPFRAGFIPWSCTIGKDSSLVVVGRVPRTGIPSHQSMFFVRMPKNGPLDPWVELNPGHPNCVANRVEQLPNGHYLVSGYVGSRIASFELNEWGLNPVFKQWYQTPDFSNMSSGYVSRINGQRYMIGGQGNPGLIGQFDSLLNKYWVKKDGGNQIPPQAMTDGSVVVGYRSGMPPYQSFFRLGLDSQYVWNMGFRDSLLARGLFGNVDLTCFTYFEDQSAVVAGRYNNGSGITDEDPIFIKIANVGTPVTSLSKPKKGPLKNETLAPWPNPTSGTLYLKQHFDKAEIHFYTLSGREMGSYTIAFGQAIQVQDYPAGIYLYRAVIDGKAYSGKIVKQ